LTKAGDRGYLYRYRGYPSNSQRLPGAANGGLVEIVAVEANAFSCMTCVFAFNSVDEGGQINEARVVARKVVIPRGSLNANT